MKSGKTCIQRGKDPESCVDNNNSRRDEFGYTTYRYLYAGNFSNISPLPWVGATHSGMNPLSLSFDLMTTLTHFIAELPILFGTHYEYRENSTDFEWEVADSMQGMFSSLQRNCPCQDTIVNPSQLSGSRLPGTPPSIQPTARRRGPSTPQRTRRWYDSHLTM